MVYFVSDIHLGSGTPAAQRRTEDAFCRWLDMAQRDATAIYLLGDIFDFWFEYRRVVPQGFVRVLGRFAELSRRGVELVFYTGNHDMWCYDYLERECGMRIVYTPQVESVGHLRFHLAHGDNMNITGQPMLRLMNAFFRSHVARVVFSWVVHPDLALKFGRWWSGKSRKAHLSRMARKSDCDRPLIPNKLSILIDYARSHRAKNVGVDAYLFGHMHHPYDFNDDIRVVFLGDWLGDVAYYAVLDDKHLELKTFNIDETIS